MRKLVWSCWLITAFSCNQSKKEDNKNKVVLDSATVTEARLTDTLVIHENTCRGCAYQYSTHFDVSDSLGIVELQRIVTTDNAGSNTGGVVDKDLFLVPLKTGRTRIKVYKFYQKEPTATDSAQHKVYEVNITN